MGLLAGSGGGVRRESLSALFIKCPIKEQSGTSSPPLIFNTSLIKGAEPRVSSARHLQDLRGFNDENQSEHRRLSRGR